MVRETNDARHHDPGWEYKRMDRNAHVIYAMRLSGGRQESKKVIPSRAGYKSEVSRSLSFVQAFILPMQK